ncbi:MAG: hypothetical protein ACREOF_06450, partial [Gemmatimonadales bacterium]
FAEPEPIRFGSLNDPNLTRAMDHYRGQGVEPKLKHYTERESLLLSGWKPAYFPGTRKEILIVDHTGRVEHIALLPP